MKKNSLHLTIAAISLCTILPLTAACGKDDTEKSSKATSIDKSVSVEKTEVMPTVAVKGDIAAGKLVYEKHCHYCHGRKGRGKGPVAIAVEPNPADFIRDKKRMAVTDLALYKALSRGITKESGGQKLEKALAMPPFMGVLTPEERWDVIAYLRKLVKDSIEENAKK